MKKLLYFIILAFALPAAAFSESVRIAQIDASGLLFKQKIKLYVSLTDDSGVPLKNAALNQFSVFESADNRDFVEIPQVTDFKIGENYEQGVNFLLMIDNSGSMYRSMEGEKASDEAEMRITFAKDAVRDFLKKTSPMDKVGLVSYNSFYNSHSKPVRNQAEIQRHLENIEKPKGDAVFTEIYGSLLLAAEEFSSIKGRKAVIILSDGENSPYFQNTKKDHQDFGKRTVLYDEPIKRLQMEGISVFAIHFGREGNKKDENLGKIAAQTGGAWFDARNDHELKMMYNKIMDQIIFEYIISYNATMSPAEQKYVRLTYKGSEGEYSANQFYYSSSVFGLPLEQFNFLLLLPLLLACILLWLITLLKFESKKQTPSLEVLSSKLGKVLTTSIDLGRETVFIGGSEKADMTIIGVPAIEKNHADIVFDEKKNIYTMISNGTVKVNNKPVKQKQLESGDIINIAGTTIVFDSGEK
ncbi:MAG: VWA domain-containing protein [Deltaproteobacteria bacterium]|nr:VWA domain-containing protein [Deltaproteobacteria bacterium]